MVYNREEAAKRAEASNTNTPGYCQLWTREIFGVDSAGDQDHDGDSDAVDGWQSEPANHRHPGDHDAPRGVPVSWSGGSKGHGHRAVSLGNRKIRSTDAGGLGRVATVDIEWVENNWGLHYLGWSNTITGVLIPMGPPPESPWAGGDVYISKLRQGQYNSDSVRRLQFRLRDLEKGGSPGLHVTGNYLEGTAEAVRKWQGTLAIDFGPNHGRSVGPKQANTLFGPNYEVHH